MPNTRSAKKRLRQNHERCLLNKSKMSRIRTEMKKFFDAIKEHSVPRAQAQMRIATKLLDKAAKTNLIHTNNVARKKSKMGKLMHELEHRHDQQAS